MKMNRLTALAVVIMLALCTLIPMTVDNSSAAEEVDEEEMIAEMQGQYGELATLIVIGLVAVAVALMAYDVAKDMVNQPDYNTDEVKQQFREIKAEDWIRMMSMTTSMTSSILPADTTLWAFTTPYWNRAVELVCAEAWGNGVSFDAESTLGKALLRTNVENYIYNWQSAVDKSYNSVLDSRLYLTGTYEPMKLKFVWTGGETTATTDGDTPFSFDLTQIVKDATSGSIVYLDARADDSGGKYNANTSSTIYNTGTSTLKLTKIKVYDGDTVGNAITIEPGKTYTMDDSESGLYRIDSAKATFAGPVSMASGEKAADVIGGLVLASGAEIYQITANGDNVDVVKAGSTSTTTSSSLVIKYTYDDTSKETELCDGTPAGYNIVRDWNNLIQQINVAIANATVAGETIWGIFDAAEASSSYLSPSSITQTVQGISLTAAEQQAIYVQAMMNIADYWEENSGKIGDIDFITNLESVDLYVYGDIYYNGTLWMENAIFTPYMTVSEGQTLTVGTETAWEGPGYAMVWAQVERYNLWDKSTSTSQHYLLNLDSNYTIQVKNIVKSGSEVNSIALTPTVIKRYTTDPGSVTPGPEPKETLDSSMLILIIMIELAIIFLLLGFIGGQPLPGAIAAVIVLVIGLLFSDVIVQLLNGTFEWPRLF